MKILRLKSFFTIFFIFFMIVYVSAQKPKSSGARISISEMMWDFGYVSRNGKVIHTYKIKNVGGDTLILAKIRTTCGCTTTPLPKQRLAPGESTDLKVIFDPQKIAAGNTTKKLQIISNDPTNPFMEVQFTAKIGKNSSLIKLTPKEINFDTVSQGTEEQRSLKIENISEEKLSIKMVEGPGDDIDLDLESKILQPGESVQVTLKLKKKAALGDLYTSFTLDFEGSKMARVSIPISAVVANR